MGRTENTAGACVGVRPTGGAGALTVADMIAKRRQRWEERQDPDYDARLVEAAARRMLSDAALRAEILARPYLLIELCFNIVDKNRKTVPFFLNEVQKDFIAQVEKHGTKKPYYILKSRQQGFTSVIEAIGLANALVRRNFAGMTLANKADNTKAIFNDKARMVYERLPEILKPSERFNSKNELFFDKLNSSWRVATATKDVGRSYTLNFVHFSEVAFYQCTLGDLQGGIYAAMVEDAFCVYETTANGFNEARDLWYGGSCINLFYEWWRTEEYACTDYEYMDNAADPWLVERIEILREKGLTREQIAWYCRKYDSYTDKNMIRQEFPCTPEEAFVSSGYCVFDRDAITNRLTRLEGVKPLRRGYFDYKRERVPVRSPSGDVVMEECHLTDIRWVDSPAGYISIHAEPAVKRNARGEITHLAPYALGGDTAGTGEDYYTAKVIDARSGYTVATLREQHMDDEQYALQCFCLGHHYHDAVIGVEINYSRVPMRVLGEYGYPNLYMRERYDRIVKEVTNVPGFETNTATKRDIVAELVRLMRDDPERECDVDTLKEMLTFVKNEHGAPSAVAGAHDDLVMALAIAHQVMGQAPMDWIAAVPEKDHFIEENFHRAEQWTEMQGNNGFMNWEDF